MKHYTPIFEEIAFADYFTSMEDDRLHMRPQYVTFYIDPKTLDAFPEYARAVILPDGKLIVADRTDVLHHSDMVSKIISRKYVSSFDRFLMVPVYRERATNVFKLPGNYKEVIQDYVLDKKTEDVEYMVKMLKKAHEINPQYEFLPEISSVRNVTN
jgi:hypothetical protein